MNRKKWNKGSIMVESAIVMPICFGLIFTMIGISVMIYDAYCLSLLCHQWEERNTGQIEDLRELQAQIDRRLIFPKPIYWVKVDKKKLILGMDYHRLRTFRIELKTKPDLKARLYHYLNARQLIDRIPFLREKQEQYLEKIRQLKKP